MVKLRELDRDILNFNTLSDEEILYLINQGDIHALEYLIQKYKTFVRTKSQTYFLIGGDREDIIQEGLIGLYKAICDFNQEKLSTFKRFADLCITRQIITAIKTATRQKHIPLNTYISLDKPIYEEGSDRTLLDMLPESRAIDPQLVLMNQEKFVYIEIKLTELLSELEREVLHLYVDGYTYQEISEQLKRHVKSVDNALQRIKRKLEELLETNEFII